MMKLSMISSSSVVSKTLKTAQSASLHLCCFSDRHGADGIEILGDLRVKKCDNSMGLGRHLPDSFDVGEGDVDDGSASRCDRGLSVSERRRSRWAVEVRCWEICSVESTACASTASWSSLLPVAILAISLEGKKMWAIDVSQGSAPLEGRGRKSVTS